MKKLYIIIGFLFCFTVLSAQEKKELKDIDIKELIEVQDTLTNDFLDSLKLNKKVVINDYMMIGIQYGAGLSRVSWNPQKNQQFLVTPYSVGITFTRYGKMFGYMPYFGIQAGLFYGREGYKFELDREKGIGDYEVVEGAESAIMDIIELPILAHVHIDFWKMKLLVNLGLFGGYRLNIYRTPCQELYQRNPSYAQYQDTFTPTDNRFDYGIKGGLGFGFIFDPIEIHLQAMYKHSFSSLYQPDHASEYYYRYAYPYNFIISAGIHFQLTKRVGKTKKDLKKEAYHRVYGTIE